MNLEDDVRDVFRTVQNKSLIVYDHGADGFVRPETLFCRRCYQYFTSKDEFDEHVKSHINIMNITSHMSYIERHICPQCDTAFEVKSDLMIHYSTVCLDAPFICKHCKHNCQHIHNLRTHLILNHRYTQDRLAQEGLYKDIFNMHVLGSDLFQRHFGEAPEFYNMGDLEYTSGSRLKPRHHKDLAFKSLNKNHVCKICDKSFSRKCVLDIHVRNHFLDLPETSYEFSASETRESTSVSFGNMEKERNESFEIQTLQSDSQKVSSKLFNVGQHSVWKKVVPGSFKTVLSPERRTEETKNTDIVKVTQKYSDFQKSVISHTDAGNSTSWKEVKLERTFQRITFSERNVNGPSTVKEVSEIIPNTKTAEVKNPDILKLTKQRTSKSNTNLQLSNDIDSSIVKEVKLKRKIKTVTTSDERAVSETSKLANGTDTIKLNGTKSIAPRAKRGKIKGTHDFDAVGKDSNNPKASCSLSNKMNVLNKTGIKRKMKLKRKVNVSSSDHENKAETSKKIMKGTSNKPRRKTPGRRILQKRNHGNVKKMKFICDLCSKKFKDGYKLRRHYLTHTGERPYTCVKCKKSFARDDHLKRHIKKVCSKRNPDKEIKVSH